ncbi:hypothetical protein [Streptomyces antimicrobicus]|uniref:DUF998 domain-containing protein n=1 Tax=Streptomyces antimicrobicus TaxID=2883108 RepID=A0ABS8B045_9ACTN|nr:hypothetical protein [Streptomyces antimicrobicus]MCB5177949.1 hypothetical protein [Streptomyces antimicrobicus]
MNTATSKRTRAQRAGALTACAGALAYTLSKVDLARSGELGMPGFPAPPEAYASIGDVTAAQLGNAALGLLMALVALLLVRPPAGRWIRRGVLLVSWAGILMVGSGVIGFAARATGLAPGLGAPPPDAGAAAAALAVGALWVAGWVVAAAGATRQGSAQEVAE